MGKNYRCPCEYCTKRIEDCRDTCEVYWEWYDQMIEGEERQFQKKRDYDDDGY
jgi:hypothetical protein